jgi:hypothetical protein
MSGCGAHKRLIPVDRVRQGILKSMTNPFPSVFKEGWTRHQMMSRSNLDLERTGWLSRNREAHLILLKLLTTPSAPLRNGIFLFMARSHPSLERRGMLLYSTQFVTCGTVLSTNQFSIFIRKNPSVMKSILDLHDDLARVEVVSPTEAEAIIQKNTPVCDVHALYIHGDVLADFSAE